MTGPFGESLVCFLLLALLIDFVLLLFPLIVAQGTAIAAAVPGYYQSLREWMVNYPNPWIVRLREFLQATLPDGQPLGRTPQELELLAHLMQNAPRVVPPLELVQVVRECELEDRYEARQILYVHRLRRQVEPDPPNPRHILNVRGVGHRFKE